MRQGTPGTLQRKSELSKTSTAHPEELKSASGAKFKPLHHSVYEGRERLGHYVRISPKRYAAYDARDRLLGKFTSTRKAFAAVGASGRGGDQ